jgi:hypothetical protein
MHRLPARNTRPPEEGRVSSSPAARPWRRRLRTRPDCGRGRVCGRPCSNRRQQPPLAVARRLAPARCRRQVRPDRSRPRRRGRPAAPKTHQVQPPARPLARTCGSGSQIAGISSRQESSASTQASIRWVLQASGASPFTFCASAILSLRNRAAPRTGQGERLTDDPIATLVADDAAASDFVSDGGPQVFAGVVATAHCASWSKVRPPAAARLKGRPPRSRFRSCRLSLGGVLDERRRPPRPVHG